MPMTQALLTKQCQSLSDFRNITYTEQDTATRRKQCTSPRSGSKEHVTRL